jgi:hypothetical protein
MLFRKDFGAIMHIDINPPLYVTKTQLYNDCSQCRTLLHTVDAFRAHCVAR